MAQDKKYPNVAIKVILLWEGKILMFKHKNGVFDLPGGTMEWGESIMETLRRELKEELDFELEAEPELFSVYNYISPGRDKHKILIQYIQKLDEQPRLTSLENVDFFWLSKEDARSIFADEKLLDKIFVY